ncbi:hypothetical protein CLAFUW4_08554 [Fulvia fulva]|uniref:RNA polymerase II subunit B1 CTD phosphatase RPAP2 homolog n=1 Tax=Passalora fulva TaxID=5499 RepID=A0A9Q8LDB9_PASFU|nr:uncharacterized protein CLAFUR5_08656 [Fulvia fulva]KAK4629213.1 hypothetical protein CLAFUR4_08557 [Fulvia fulva]KAK4630293.1 hypothetical protein CLAFUR0_08552 [Fulvia fulva]UJO15289.1 hypothetical protein CLAFUR5_08656 [Fulvia fulva]WPV12910.1 hypothetical protein CLAFUW4_08554 [Fulvia fulva]WPV27906.1 hypothetical protein CLAFUW7_08552 [Fulvia fulva]
MSTKVPVKSILKTQGVKKTPTVTDEQKAKVEKDKQNLNIALKHAYLIQQHRKHVEAAILDAITTLIDLPAASTFTTEESETYVKLIRSFQPSDFDSLIEERRVDERCGYGLCGNKPRCQTMGSSVAWKLKKGMSDYCSDACAKKGLFLKAQLSEVPAWERLPEQQPDIQLHADDRPADTDTAQRRANRTARVDEWRKKVASNEELAMERGEKASSMRPNQVMADMIVEKNPKPFEASSLQAGAGHFNTIEGYQTKRYNKKKKGEKRDSDDSETDDDAET